LTFETEEGVGTTFIIRLPIQPADAHAGNLAETATFERGR
jgi:hypothetical protein